MRSFPVKDVPTNPKTHGHPSPESFAAAGLVADPPSELIDAVVKQVGAVSAYRKQALSAYGRAVKDGIAHSCAYCGFGITAILEVAHLDQNRKNNAIENLAILCPNCHKMHDLKLLPTKVIKEMRDLHDLYKDAFYGDRNKDAALKAAAARKRNSATARRSAAGKKATKTRAAKLKAEGGSA